MCDGETIGDVDDAVAVLPEEGTDHAGQSEFAACIVVGDVEQHQGVDLHEVHLATLR